MAIATYAAYKAKIGNSQRVEGIATSVRRSSGGFLWSSWLTLASNIGAAPAGAVVPTNTTNGSLGQSDSGSGNGQRLARAVLSQNGTQPLAVYLIDRLSHQGALSGTTTGAQTTNLPTAALTRFTSAVDVQAAIEIYTTVGSTATTATASYTNSAGTAARTSLAQVFGGAGAQGALSVFMPFSLQAGDVGVKSVESVTLAASTVSAAGNFGVTLYRMLHGFSIPPGSALTWDAVLNNGGIMPLIPDGACLQWLTVSATGTVPSVSYDLELIED